MIDTPLSLDVPLSGVDPIPYLVSLRAWAYALPHDDEGIPIKAKIANRMLEIYKYIGWNISALLLRQKIANRDFRFL